MKSHHALLAPPDGKNSMLEIESPSCSRHAGPTWLPGLEWTGCVLALAGSGLLALNNASSGYGFAFFLVSNLCWIGTAVLRRNLPMLLMYFGFTATSVMGLWNWLR